MRTSAITAGSLTTTPMADDQSTGLCATTALSSYSTPSLRLLKASGLARTGAKTTRLVATTLGEELTFLAKKFGAFTRNEQLMVSGLMTRLPAR